MQSYCREVFSHHGFSASTQGGKQDKKKGKGKR